MFGLSMEQAYRYMPMIVKTPGVFTKKTEIMGMKEGVEE